MSPLLCYKINVFLPINVCVVFTYSQVFINLFTMFRKKFNFKFFINRSKYGSKTDARKRNESKRRRLKNSRWRSFPAIPTICTRIPRFNSISTLTPWWGVAAPCRTWAYHLTSLWSNPQYRGPPRLALKLADSNELFNCLSIESVMLWNCIRYFKFWISNTIVYSFVLTKFLMASNIESYVLF